MRSRLSISAVLLLTLVVVAAARPHRAPTASSRQNIFPSAKGTEWTYAGTVTWVDDGNEEKTKQLRWTSTIVDSFDHGAIAATLLRGGVWDLMWYTPDRTPSDYILLRLDDAYYVLAHESVDTFAALREKGRDAVPEGFPDELWFRVPLNEGALYKTPDYDRDDSMYAWFVEQVKPAKFHVSGGQASPRTEYTLVYRTNPDHQIVGVVPGIGITSYIYSHHGTTSEADVHLVAFRNGAGKRQSAASADKHPH